MQIKDVYNVSSVSVGKMFFNLYNIKITCEILFFTKFKWLPHNSVS